MATLNPQEQAQYNALKSAMDTAGTDIGGLADKLIANKSAVTSSAQAGQQQQKKQALNDAGNAITSNNNPNAGITQQTNNQKAFDAINNNNNKSVDKMSEIADRTMKAIKLSYDAALASKNFKYDQLQKQLQTDYDKHTQVAESQAAALNPYSQVRGAQTAKNFTGKLTDNYNEASAQLQRQADLAQQELEAGNYKAYAELQNSLDSGVISLNKEMTANLLDFNKQVTQQQQFDATLATKYSDDYRSYLAQIPYSPGDIQKMSDEEIMNTTAGRLGAASGLTPDMVRQDMAEGSYKSQQLSQSQERLIKAQNGGGGITAYQSIGLRNQIEDNLRQNEAVKAYGQLVNFGVPDVIKQFNEGTVDNIADTVLMRSLAKVTDPSTGVREEEYRTFEDAVGAINRVYKLPSKWVGSGSLTEAGRAAIIREIETRYNSRLEDYTNQYSYYSDQASRAGLTVPPPYKASGDKKSTSGTGTGTGLNLKLN